MGVILVGLNMRTAVASLSPLLGMVEESFSLPLWTIGALGALPPLCFALCGLVVPVLSRRVGPEIAMCVTVSLLTLGLLGRALSDGAITLLASSALAFGAIGAGNVLLPPLVKKHFPHRYGLVTTAYVTAMSISVVIPPLFAVQMAVNWGWRSSLATWAVFAAVALVPWLVTAQSSTDQGSTDQGSGDQSSTDERGTHQAPAARGARTPRGRLLRSRGAWALVVMFAASGITAHVSFGWMPVMLVEHASATTEEAAGMLALFAAMGIPAALLVPPIMSFQRGRIAVAVAACLLLIAGCTGLILRPEWAWAWVTMIGLGPLLFPFTIVQLGRRARTDGMAMELSGFVQGAGYLIAAAAPPLVGVLYQMSGGWAVPLWMLAAAGVVALMFARSAASSQMIEDEPGTPPR